jgi:hypothetical protein
VATPAQRERWLLAAAALFLLLGFLNLAPGLARPGFPYRPWSFSHHSYSDVIALAGDRYLTGRHPVPYLEDQIEYPVLLGFLLWLPSYAPGGLSGHFVATYLLLCLSLLFAVRALCRMEGTAPYWLAATPALICYAGLNWDLFGIALTAFALWALERGRPATGGLLSALAVCFKLFPVALLPPAVGAMARGRRLGDLVRAGSVFVGVVLAVNLPFAVWARTTWSYFFRYNAARGAENSLWDAVGLHEPETLNRIGLATLALAGLFVLVGAWRAGPAQAVRAVRLGTAFVLVVWIATNKVWSPQYALYGFLAGALAAAPGWLFVSLSAVAVADYHIAFEYLHRGSEPWIRFHLFIPDELLRTGSWLVLAAWMGWQLVRLGRLAPAPGPAAAPPVAASA